jgi:hypothetical protein
MTLDSQASDREKKPRRSVWRRPEPRRFIRLTWPALGAWLCAAFYFVPLHAALDSGAGVEWIRGPGFWFQMPSWAAGTLLGWLGVAYAIISGISRAPVPVRVVAALVNLTPLVASLAGYFFTFYLPVP